MCSIAGIIWFDVAAAASMDSVGCVRDALQVLDRRGPDESATSVVSERIVLGGNRLIIRGGPGVGTMPFTGDGCVLYYNGEIYDYRRWSSDALSDGEILIPLFRAHGPRAFGMVDGEFAVSLWNEHDGTVYLARDCFGTKPLYFSLTNDRLLWASSASAIHAMEPHPICTTVKGPLYAHTLAPQEPYSSHRGIWTVPPGHCLAATTSGVQLFAFHTWAEASMDGADPAAVFSALDTSMQTRLEHHAPVGIAMSAGIDSGIIAFSAEALGIPYRIYSVVRMFGKPTIEYDAIQIRAERLKHAQDVILLDCDEEAYALAVADVFSDDYYDAERLDDGNIPTHTVMRAIARDGIRVAIDGTGGDELFHGYPFRHQSRPVPNWPRPWRSAPSLSYYTLFTTLIDFTAKSDRAGGHFSIETRFPYQSRAVCEAAMALQMRNELKWPLRRYLTAQLPYGAPLPLDETGKVGFSIKNHPRELATDDLRRAWLERHPETCHAEPLPFPFTIGIERKDAKWLSPSIAR